MYQQLKLLNYKFDVLTRTLPESIQPTSNTILGWGKTVVTLLLNRKLSLYELHIEDDAQKSCIGYLGSGTNLSFIANQIGSSVLDSQSKWQVPWWQAQKVIQRTRRNYDGIILEMPQRVLSQLNLMGGIFTLPYFRWRIKTNCSWEEIEGRFNKETRREVRKNHGYDCIITDKQDDLLHFYRNIYYPYITQNFGKMAQPSTFEELSYYFQRGWLILVKNTQGEIMGGTMCFVINNVMYEYINASTPGLDRQIQSSVTVKFYTYMIRLAMEKGCTCLDLGYARPLLDDGIARYKRKWGAYIFADTSQNWGIWIGLGRDSAKTASFLTQHPWAWLDESNQIRGYVVENNRGAAPLTSAKVRKICKRLWSPGLHNIVVCAPGGFAAETPLIDNPISGLGPATEWVPDDTR